MNGVLIKHDNSPKGYAIVKWADYPSTNPNEPLVGLPEGYEWLVPYTANTETDYDSRIWELQRNEGPTTIPHPQYPIIHQWRIEHSLVKRPAQYIIDRIREAESYANSTLLRDGEQVKMQALVNLCNNKLLNGIPLTESEKAVMNRANEIGERVWQNASIAENKIAAVLAGNEPNIDADWLINDLSDEGFPFND